MEDYEVVTWLERLKNSLKGKFENELELRIALDIAIRKIGEIDHSIKSDDGRM